MTIRPTKLFRLRAELPREEAVICLTEGMTFDAVYWQEGNRPSRLGGYIGDFRETYTHACGVSPHGRRFSNMPTRYFEPIN